MNLKQQTDKRLSSPQLRFQERTHYIKSNFKSYWPPGSRTCWKWRYDDAACLWLSLIRVCSNGRIESFGWRYTHKYWTGLARFHGGKLLHKKKIQTVNSELQPLRQKGAEWRSLHVTVLFSGNWKQKQWKRETSLAIFPTWDTSKVIANKTKYFNHNLPFAGWSKYYILCLFTTQLNCIWDVKVSQIIDMQPLHAIM